MPNQQHYYPVVKGKEGEFKALKESDATLKSHMSPILELLDYNPRPLSPEKLAKRKKPLRTYRDYLVDNLKDIISFWRGIKSPIFIDTHLIPEDVLLSSGTDFIQLIHKTLFYESIYSSPAIYLNYGKRIASEYKKIVKKYECDVCLRLTVNDLDNDDLAARIDAFLSYYEIEPNNVHIVIDNGHVLKEHMTSLIRLTVSFINDVLPYVKKWKTLTLVAAAFPIDLSEYGKTTEIRVERNDWRLWNTVRLRKLKRVPSFGDYVIAHPDIKDLGPIIPNISASLRYTSVEEWIVMKGKAVKTHGHIQTHALSEQIVKMPEYDGELFSPGDMWIKKCSLKIVGPGNSTTWRQTGSSRHFYKVIHQLSSLGAPSVSVAP